MRWPWTNWPGTTAAQRAKISVPVMRNEDLGDDTRRDGCSSYRGFSGWARPRKINYSDGGRLIRFARPMICRSSTTPAFASWAWPGDKRVKRRRNRDARALTRDGIRLIPELDRFRIVQDTSHLAEESFWQLLELTSEKAIASHSNCRSIVPTDRQLSDAMIRAIAARDGVIGINFYDRFLIPPDEYGKRRATLADVVRHMKHICDLLGDATHVGIGTDMDGGLGREQIPVEIETSADLPRLADALSSGGFPDEAVRGIMGENWMRFFRSAFPW